MAYFLATQHNRTAVGSGVNFEADCRYLDAHEPRLRALCDTVLKSLGYTVIEADSAEQALEKLAESADKLHPM